MSAKPGLLMFYPYMVHMAGEAAARFDLLKMWEEKDPESAISAKGASVVAILTTGQDYPINAALFDSLPALKLIVAVGSGYAGVDVAAARARGVMVANAGDTHSGDVADHAIGLAFGLVQQLMPGDAYVREGTWAEKGFPPHRRALSAQRFGILGMGLIGRAIAERLVPFGCEIGWWGPNPKAVDWQRHESPLALAKWCTVLMVAARGDCLGLVDRGMIDAIGADGYIVNVSRGGVIDEDALIEALRERRLAGAGLDVFREEPAPAARWRDVPGTILSAHMAGQTTEAMARLRSAAARNLLTALDGGAVVNEIMA
jgi:lactate dehydrogenase-like 2-hydroxyacid dehydrogenase